MSGHAAAAAAASTPTERDARAEVKQVRVCNQCVCASEATRLGSYLSNSRTSDRTTGGVANEIAIPFRGPNAVGASVSGRSLFAPRQASHSAIWALNGRVASLRTTHGTGN